jgi:hypothetical protein
VRRFLRDPIVVAAGWATRHLRREIPAYLGGQDRDTCAAMALGRVGDAPVFGSGLCVAQRQGHD